MTTTVLADAFKPSDWREEEKWTDPNAPEDWVRTLQLAIPSTDPDQPIVLEVLAGSFDPHPVVDVLTTDHSGGDLMALLEALPHIINVLYEINKEIER